MISMAPIYDLHVPAYVKLQLLYPSQQYSDINALHIKRAAVLWVSRRKVRLILLYSEYHKLLPIHRVRRRGATPTYGKVRFK